MPCVAASLVSLVCVSRRRQHAGSHGRGCRSAHGQKAPDAGARCIGAVGDAREQRTRGGCRPQPSPRLKGGAPGTEVVEGARAAGGTRFSRGRVSTSRDASAVTLDVESGTRPLVSRRWWWWAASTCVLQAVLTSVPFEEMPRVWCVRVVVARLVEARDDDRSGAVWALR